MALDEQCEAGGTECESFVISRQVGGLQQGHEL